MKMYMIGSKMEQLILFVTYFRILDTIGSRSEKQLRLVHTQNRRFEDSLAKKNITTTSP